MSDRPRVLFVDDDERLLSAAKRIMRKELDLHVACGAQQGLETMRESGPFAVLVSDQNMPGMNGATFLSKAAEDWPLTVRIMLTGNNDQGTAAAAVNDGRVFRFKTKPCSPENLLEVIREGVSHHKLIAGEKELLERTLSGSVKVLVDMLAITQPAAFAKAAAVRRWARSLAPAIKGVRAWELDMAAMLWPLGDITLPDELLARRDAGDELSATEQELVEQSPAAARDLIANIPRLEGVAEAIYYSRTDFSGDGFPGDGRTGADLPRIARILRVLIDIASADDAPLAERIEALGHEAGRYDPEMLAIAAATLREEVAQDAATMDVKACDVAPSALLEGDRVARDIRNTDGQLLLAAGHELTRAMIQKLRHLHRLGGMTDAVAVLRMETRASAA